MTQNEAACVSLTVPTRYLLLPLASIQALVVSVVVVVVDKSSDLTFQVAGQVVVFQLHSVLRGQMPSLNLALGLRVMWYTTNMIHALFIEIVGQKS